MLKPVVRRLIWYLVWQREFRNFNRILKSIYLQHRSQFHWNITYYSIESLFIWRLTVWLGACLHSKWDLYRYIWRFDVYKSIWPFFDKQPLTSIDRPNEPASISCEIPISIWKSTHPSMICLIIFHPMLIKLIRAHQHRFQSNFAMQIISNRFIIENLKDQFSDFSIHWAIECRVQYAFLVHHTCRII